MLRAATSKAVSAVKPSLMKKALLAAAGSSRLETKRSYGRDWTAWRQDNWKVVEDFYCNMFNSDMDHWQMRKALYELHCIDMIPEPCIVEAVLRACRRLNDHSLAVRYLESLVIKCNGWNWNGMSSQKHLDVYRWVVQEVRPVLDELGISTPEELGYDKPELFSPDDSWWEEEWYDHYPNVKNHPHYQYIHDARQPDDGSAGQ